MLSLCIPSRKVLLTTRKILLTTIFGLFSVPMLIVGGYLLVCSVRSHVADLYYADYLYAPIGLIWLGIGLLSFRITWYGAWHRSFYGLLFLVPVFLTLVSTQIIPNEWPSLGPYGTDLRFVSNVTSSLGNWYEQRQHFPADDSEFWEAIAKGTPPAQYRGGRTVYSKYEQHGDLLPYVIVVVEDASGPRVADVSPRPGVLYYCVSRDLQEFWITMTGLESDLASTGSLRQLTWWEKKPWVHKTGSDYRPESGDGRSN